MIVHFVVASFFLAVGFLTGSSAYLVSAVAFAAVGLLVSVRYTPPTPSSDESIPLETIELDK